ncbi:MAG: Rdx family protein [Chloroflexi bacterium]|nr:Rdx family protein [Chloroflexota bacterium]
MAFWMGSEIFAAGGSQTAITLKPGQSGVFKVTLNGELVWDKAEQGRYPTLPDAKEIKAKVATMTAVVTV